MDRFRQSLLIPFVFGAFVSAHQIDEITADCSIRPEQVELRFDLDAAYMLPEFRGDEDLAPQDLAWLRTQPESEWERIRAESEEFITACVALESDGERIPFRFSFPDWQTDPPKFASQGEPEMLPMIELVATAPRPGSAVNLRWSEPLGVVLILRNEGEVVPMVSGETVSLTPRSPTDAAGDSIPGLVRWCRIGWDHIIPKGSDHILFILGIFLLSPRWKPLLKQSLTFTLAHSTTLIFATLGWIDLPSKPIEVAIALSIAWIALENFGKLRLTGLRYGTIAGFGLIHGLGFASMLAPLLPPDRPQALVTGIVGFNLGVEAGQIAILCLAFLACGWWRPNHFIHVRLWGSICIAITGMVWAVERAL